MRRLPTPGYAAFGLVTAYALALSGYAFVNAGWKPHRVETAWFLFAFAFLVGLAGALWRGVPPREAPPPSRHWWWLSAVMAVALVAYSPGVTVGFLSDDFVLLELTDVSAGWRQGTTHLLRVLPVWVLQALDAAAPTWSPVLAHVVSLALHLVNGALVHAIARRLRLDPIAAIVAAALFLLFPASAEAVVWASGLQDVLMTTASLAFVLATLDARHPAVLLGCALTGLLSKETAVVMPLLAAAALWARGSRPPPVVIRTLVVCAVATTAFGVWRVQAGAGTLAVAPTRYLVKEIVATAFGTLAVPWTADELRAVPSIGIVLALVVVVAAWAILVRTATTTGGRVAIFGLTWVILGVAPVYALFFVSNTLEGSRYLYLPSAGWSVLLAGAIPPFTSTRAHVVCWALCGVAALWAVGAYAHVTPWRQAARERERILTAAMTTPVSGCGPAAFVGATDNISGAYVFRNGLAPALRRAGLEAVVDQAGSAGCVFTWTGDTFVRTR